jgi:hypothetical protein
MKQLSLIILLLLSALTVDAQQYAVYRVKGSAIIILRQRKIPLSRGMWVAPKDIVNVSAGSELKLFSAQLREMVTLNGQCAGSLASLMASQRNSRQNVTQQYFDFIVKNLSGKGGTEEQLQGGRSTAIFRDDNDSLLIDYVFFPQLKPIIFHAVPVDNLIDSKPTLQCSPMRLPPAFNISTPWK